MPEAGASSPITIGTHTNPRRYERDYGFRSPVVARAGGVATALWTTGTAPARTSGKQTVIYSLTIENNTGAAQTGWLEIAGVVVTVPYWVQDKDTIAIDFIAGLKVGNNDVNCNSTANNVGFQIIGLEV